MKNPTTTNHHTLIAGLLAIALVLCAIGAGTINYTETLDNLLVRTNASIANLVVTGNATLGGITTGSSTNLTVPGTFTGDVIQATKAFRSYQGTLTHAGTVTLDFDGTTTVNSLTLTGALTIAFSNVGTNKTYRLKVINSQATNCAATFPATMTTTNFLGGAPSYYTAGRVTMLSFEPWGSTDASVICATAETQ